MTEKEKEKWYVYSWDNCVFSALFNNERDKSIADIVAVWDQVYDGKAGMIVSSAIISELLIALTDASIADKFEKFLALPTVNVVDVNRKVARLAAKLRQEWQSAARHPNEKRNFKTIDAIVLATAIQYDVDVLHSYDPDLLRFNSHSIAAGIAITKPVLGGGIRMLFGPPNAESNGRCWMSLYPKCTHRTCEAWEVGRTPYMRERTLQHS